MLYKFVLPIIEISKKDSYISNRVLSPIVEMLTRQLTSKYNFDIAQLLQQNPSYPPTNALPKQKDTYPV